MVESGANIHALNNDNRNVLFSTALESELSVTKYFLEKGVDPNATSHYRRTSAFGEFSNYFSNSKHKMDSLFCFLLHGGNPHIESHSFFENSTTIYQNISKFSEAVEILKNFENGIIWTASKDYLFPSSFREITFTFLLCLKAVSVSVPKPLISIIFNFLAFKIFPLSKNIFPKNKEHPLN